VHGVTLNQDRTGESGRVPAQILIDADHWARFDAVARAQNRSRSAQIRELVRREVEAFEASLEQAA
jgi:predicted transcriptional regulator